MEDNKNKVADVPYIVHEADMARQERTIKRLWISLVIVSVLSLLLITASWVGFMAYEAQFEEVVISEVEQSTTGDAPNYVVGGDFNGFEAESNNHKNP